MFPISRSLSTSRWRTDELELGSRLERPIHFECKLNEPMHIGMRLLHPAAADHSVSINRQQVQRIFSFSLRSRAVFIVLLHLPIWECLKTLVLADGDSAVVVSFVEWIAHIRLHYPLLCCSDHLPCALQHAKRANTSLKECVRKDPAGTIQWRQSFRGWRALRVTIFPFHDTTRTLKWNTSSYIFYLVISSDSIKWKGF